MRSSSFSFIQAALSGPSAISAPGPFRRKYTDGEEPEAAARREFFEEMGLEPKGTLQPLGELLQRGGKGPTVRGGRRPAALYADGSPQPAAARGKTAGRKRPSLVERPDAECCIRDAGRVSR